MGQRRQHGHSKGIDVVQRQHRQHPVMGLQRMLGADGRCVGCQVGLGQHHPLGLPGRAGGVHQQRHGLGQRGRQVGLGLGPAVVVWRAHQHADVARNVLQQRAHLGLPIGADDHQPAVAVRQHIAHLVWLRQQIDRVDAPAALHRAQQPLQRSQPVGHDQRHRIARHAALRQQQRCHLPAALGQCAVIQAWPTVAVDGVDGIWLQAGLMRNQGVDR